VFRDDIRLVVLAGDTTALPAIRELSVAVPSAADVRILIEAPPTERLSWDAPTATASAPGPRNTSAPGSGGTGAPGPGGMVQVEWIDQGGLVRLGPGIIPPGWNPRDPALTLWLAAEAHTVSQIRRDLLGAGVPPQALHAAGYWRATPRPLA
jgi:NADPH-dependent ferric siderophore reductase